MARLTINAETAYALDDALSYYLSASEDNFGSGIQDRDVTRTRSEVRMFMNRLDHATHA